MELTDIKNEFIKYLAKSYFENMYTKGSKLICFGSAKGSDKIIALSLNADITTHIIGKTEIITVNKSKI